MLLLVASVCRSGEVDESRLASIREAMNKFVADGDLAGAVTVVGRSTGIIHHEAVGVLRTADKSPMPKDALFRIASMTKPITAMAIMMLVDEGKLSVDDPVEKHLPEFKGQMMVLKRDKDTITLGKPARPITIRDLLTHTSGLPSMGANGLADLYTKRNRTLAEATLYFSQRPLDFEPGSKWSYCNSGIDTLGRIVEVASGMSFESFLKRRLFDPLLMHDTTFRPTAAQLVRAAPTFAKQDGELVVAPNNLIDLPAGAKHPIPAGGLYSTGADLAKLYEMMLRRGTRGNVRYLSEASIAAMTSVQTGDIKTGFTPGMAFGFGFGVVREPQGVTASLSPGSYGHGGAFGTQGWIDPKKDLYVILLIQRVGLANADGSRMRQALQDAAEAAVK